MRLSGVAFIVLLASCDTDWSVSDLEGGQYPQSLQANQGLADPQALQVAALNPTPGGSPSTAGASCQALFSAGMTMSGVYWVMNPTTTGPVRVYCDQDINGGGWALIYNSVLGAATLDFWNIPYRQRLERRGRLSLDSNYYDGFLYQTGSASYMDVLEDLQGKTEVALVASSSGIDQSTMRFANPVRVGGSSDVFVHQFAAGWSAPDHEGDSWADNNCATYFNNVSQHYGSCLAYSLGSDADASGGDSADQRLGPHVHAVVLTTLGLSGDGSSYSRVRAIRRYVKW